ncbi:MAG: aspartate/glutamate racemase family protein [SAR324 cluster bacterium]|nr:aspartate/glutamate racemase family protein [SAR324 cluster bacterium]
MKTIGILGGMGPEASIFFYQKILDNTPAQKDQDHIPTLIYSNPQIPNRTDAILSNQLEKTAKALEESAKILEEGGASFIVIPCNTAHFWIEDIKAAVNIPVFDMIEETVRFLVENLQLKKVGLLSTIGTQKTEVFQKKGEAFSLEILIPNQFLSQKVMEVIGEIKKGNKSKTLLQAIEEVRIWFQNLGVDQLVLGCTELPLLFENETEWALDPMDVLARVAVAEALNSVPVSRITQEAS